MRFMTSPYSGILNEIKSSPQIVKNMSPACMRLLSVKMENFIELAYMSLLIGVY